MHKIFETYKTIKKIKLLKSYDSGQQNFHPSKICVIIDNNNNIHDMHDRFAYVQRTSSNILQLLLMKYNLF